jgi:hypothetical protein
MLLRTATGRMTIATPARKTAAAFRVCHTAHAAITTVKTIAFSRVRLNPPIARPSASQFRFGRVTRWSGRDGGLPAWGSG